jgi:predicted Zn-dependent protease
MKEWAAFALTAKGSCNADVGLFPEARQALNESLAVSENSDSQGNAVRAFALIGDAARAEKLIADLEKESPHDLLLNNVKIPTARAILSLQRNQPAQAVTALDAAKPYDLGADRQLIGTYMSLYIRGEAYLQAHDGANAALQFQKILDHRGIDPTSPYLPLSKVGLGRAYALQGDTAKAKAAYQDFFATWKDADPDVPILKTAKAEYEKLK